MVLPAFHSSLGSAFKFRHQVRLSRKFHSGQMPQLCVAFPHLDIQLLSPSSFGHQGSGNSMGMQIPCTPDPVCKLLLFTNMTTLGWSQTRIGPRTCSASSVEACFDVMTETHSRLPTEPNDSVLNGGPIASEVQAADAFDSSVLTEAHHEFRSMSTPRTDDLGPVN